MSDLLAAIGDWIESRIKTRGVIYKLGLGVLFALVITLFARDILSTAGGGE